MQQKGFPKSASAFPRIARGFPKFSRSGKIIAIEKDFNTCFNVNSS